MVSFDDNSTAILNPVSRNLVSTIFPPPTSTSVHQIKYCMKRERIFILLSSSSLCIYKIDKSTAVLENMLYFNQFKVINILFNSLGF